MMMPQRDDPPSRCALRRTSTIEAIAIDKLGPDGQRVCLNANYARRTTAPRRYGLRPRGCWLVL